MKHLRSVISAYVTLKKFTPGLQKIYTDISAISATFSNSADMVADKVAELEVDIVADMGVTQSYNFGQKS